MGSFSLVLSQMAFLFTCILLGYIISRLRVLPENADKVLSKLETYVLAPALVINSFRTNCTPENLSDNASLIGYSCILLGVSLVMTLAVAPLFTKDPEEIGVYRYSLLVPNYGFMGNALVQGLYGEEGLFRFLIFSLPVTAFVYGVGVMWLTAGRQKVTWKSFVNPSFLSMIIGLLLGVTGLPLPAFVTKTVSSCAACFSPIAMILTGIVIAHFDLKELFSQKKVYVLTLVRIIIIPLIVFAAVRALHLPQTAAHMIIIFSVMPLGMNTIIYPAAFGLNEKPGASMAVISNIIGLITVPALLSFML